MAYVAGIVFTVEESDSLVLNDKLGTNMLEGNR